MPTLLQAKPAVLEFFRHTSIPGRTLIKIYFPTRLSGAPSTVAPVTYRSGPSAVGIGTAATSQVQEAYRPICGRDQGMRPALWLPHGDY